MRHAKLSVAHAVHSQLRRAVPRSKCVRAIATQPQVDKVLAQCGRTALGTTHQVPRTLAPQRTRGSCGFSSCAPPALSAAPKTGHYAKNVLRGLRCCLRAVGPGQRAGRASPLAHRAHIALALGARGRHVSSTGQLPDRAEAPAHPLALRRSAPTKTRGHPAHTTRGAPRPRIRSRFANGAKARSMRPAPARPGSASPRRAPKKMWGGALRRAPRASWGVGVAPSPTRPEAGTPQADPRPRFHPAPAARSAGGGTTPPVQISP